MNFTDVIMEEGDPEQEADHSTGLMMTTFYHLMLKQQLKLKTGCRLLNDFLRDGLMT